MLVYDLDYDPKKIIALREERGWNQAELAKRSGLSQPSVWALEHGDTVDPKFSTLAVIAVAFGVPMSALLADPKEGEDLQGELVAAFGALKENHKATVLAVAQTLLKQQKR